MINTAIQLARAAGGIALAASSSRPQVTQKGLRDLVTHVDVAAQRAIVAGLRARFPDHAILAEEEGFDSAQAAEWLWVIDPIDGTTNFSRGMPSYSISIGLYHEGEPHLGVVYDPTRDHLFYAQRGQGAWLGGQRLRVSQTEHLADMLVGHDWARGGEERQRLLDLIERLSHHALAIRTLGTAALGLCYVAAGWYDAFFHVDLRFWDVAAAASIIEEAGGTITSLAGAPLGVETRTCLATNGLLHDLLQETLAAPNTAAGCQRKT